MIERKSDKSFYFIAIIMQEQTTEKTYLTLTSDKIYFKNDLYFIKIRSATLIEGFWKNIKYLSETELLKKTIGYFNAHRMYRMSIAYHIFNNIKSRFKESLMVSE